MSVTIKEVARAAGVSIATVSRVFNDSGPVGAETRRRVEAAARALNYMPNSAARSLITSRTQTLGVLLPDLHGEFFSEMIRGIDVAARRQQFHLLLSSSHDDRLEVEGAMQAMRGRVDGLVVMLPDLEPEALWGNLPEQAPVVLLNTNDATGRFDLLNIDNFGGACAMMRHLLQRGHRRIAAITGGPCNFDVQERLRGYRSILCEAGTWARELEIAGDFSKEAGYRGALQALALSPRPTALFAFNDSMAIGAMSALREAGLRVPEDVAVVGFDDIPMAQYVSPGLTSVHVPIFEMGRRAIERLIEAVRSEGSPPRTREVLPTKLVVRASCGLN